MQAKNFIMGVALALAAGGAVTPACAAEIEVMHYWDIAGDARAVALLKQRTVQLGHTWNHFMVAGGGNGLAMSVLDSRIRLRNPPTSAVVKTPGFQEWARSGSLANLDAVAKQERWDAVLPPVIARMMKYDGHYVAAPVNLHRDNWMWVNTTVFKLAGARVPTTWDEFFQAADKLRSIGVTPLAHGGQPWQNTDLFQAVALSVGGAEFHRNAFSKLDPKAISSPQMEQVLNTFRRLRRATDWQTQQYDWTEATRNVIRGKAAMQIVGDWAKPFFQAAADTSGFQFQCVAPPGTGDGYIFTSDSFVMFTMSDPAKIRAQQDFARLVMQPEVQQQFNLIKGSIPANQEADISGFDRCGQQSAAAFKQASQSNSLVPSFSMSIRAEVEDAVRDVISDFWRDDRITTQQAMTRLVAVLTAPAPGRSR